MRHHERVSSDVRTAGDGRVHSSRDEAAVIRRVIAGDKQGFRSLIDLHGGLVYRICYRLLGDAHEAEDAAQDALLTAYRALPTFRGEGSLRGWFARIASRRALAHRARRPHALPLEHARDLPTPAEAGPAEAALVAERRAALLRAIERLPDPQREVVTLSYFGELTLAEIAAQTGRPIGTVKSHLHRALERLRTMSSSDFGSGSNDR